MSEPKRPQTPNIKKLAARFMAKEAIPSGGGLQAGIDFLKSPDRITQAAKRGIEQAFESVDAIRNAPDPNEFKEMSDDQIAGKIVEEIEAKAEANRRARMKR